MPENPGGEEEEMDFGKRVILAPSGVPQRPQEKEQTTETQDLPGGAEYFYGEYLPELKGKVEKILQQEDQPSSLDKGMDISNRQKEMFQEVYDDALTALWEMSTYMVEEIGPLREKRETLKAEKQKTIEGEGMMEKIDRLRKASLEEIQVNKDIVALEEELEDHKKRLTLKAVKPLEDLVADPQKTLAKAERDYKSTIRRAREDWPGRQDYPTPVDIDGAGEEMTIEELSPLYFRDIEPLGKGAMGMIYKAVPLSADRPALVLKVAQRGFEDEAQREVEIGRKILQTAIEKALRQGAGETELNPAAKEELERQMERMLVATRMMTIGEKGFYGLPPGTRVEIMPLGVGMEGNDYMDSIEQQERVEKACEVMTEICQMVQMCHDAGVIHRDIKPANFWIDQKGGDTLPKLADFGLAIQKDLPLPDKEGTIVGTPVFMSPESGQGQYSEKSDVYALGVSLYVMVSGIYDLYPGQKPIELLIAKISGQDRVLSLKNPLLRPDNDQSPIPKQLRVLILQATAKEVEDRSVTAGEMGKTIADYLTDLRGGVFAGADLESSIDDLWLEDEPQREAPKMTIDKPEKGEPKKRSKTTGGLDRDVLEDLLAKGKKIKKEAKAPSTVAVAPKQGDIETTVLDAPETESESTTADVPPESEPQEEDVLSWMDDL